MAIPKLSEEDEAKIREGHMLGRSLNSIAKELGVNPSTVSRWAKREGLLWTGVPAASTAVRDRLAFNRLRLAEAALADALAIRERLWEAHEVIVNTPAGPERMTMDLPDAKATAEFSKAVERLANTHSALSEYTKGASTEAAKSMLMQMQEALEKFAAEYDEENGGQEPPTPTDAEIDAEIAALADETAG